LGFATETPVGVLLFWSLEELRGSNDDAVRHGGLFLHLAQRGSV
jgi:hypothetical protein